jgi:tRNA pseudouridine55 synthase
MNKDEANIVLVDKPASWTSFDVVAKIRGQIRRELQEKGQKPTKKQLRVGHAGTLDPFATGLLIILKGDACKQAGEFLKLGKIYEFTAKLGESSTTGDPEGEITPVSDTIPSKEAVLEALDSLTGQITQIPPIYSAIKIGGKRAYKLARDGKDIDMPPRQVEIYRLELISYQYPYIKAVCNVSSGTYIRTLVEDIGNYLKSGAYCTELRRTKIGEYDIKDAKSIDNF